MLNQTINSNWPPNYVIRRSQKAKKISLVIKPTMTLEIVLPKRTSLAEGINFLNQQRDWVLKHLDKVKISYENATAELPQKLDLNLIQKTWEIRYHQFSHQARTQLIEIANSLVLIGKFVHIQSIAPIFKKWLKRKSKSYLSHMLQKISLECGLNYNGVAIRGQKTLWGSCSGSGKISLNYKLIFLPYQLVRYVMIHELCHTIHLNHSKKFWALVRQFEPNYKYLDKELRNGENFIPKWLMLYD